MDGGNLGGLADYHGCGILWPPRASPTAVSERRGQDLLTVVCAIFARQVDQSVPVVLEEIDRLVPASISGSTATTFWRAEREWRAAPKSMGPFGGALAALVAPRPRINEGDYSGPSSTTRGTGTFHGAGRGTGVARGRGTIFATRGEPCRRVTLKVGADRTHGPAFPRLHGMTIPKFHVKHGLLRFSQDSRKPSVGCSARAKHHRISMQCQVTTRATGST